MQTYQHAIPASYTRTHNEVSVVTRFLNWSEGQEHYRFVWLAAILAVHGCILAPLTLLCVFSAGNDAIYWWMTTGSMAMCLFTNLAAMPTKITIPVFFISVLINLAVVAMCAKEIFF